MTELMKSYYPLKYFLRMLHFCVIVYKKVKNTSATITSIIISNIIKIGSFV